MELDRQGSIWNRDNRNGINRNWSKLEQFMSGFDGTRLFEESYNLFNKDAVVSGVLSGTTGEVNSHDTFVTSEFIPVSPNEYLRIGPETGITVLYDSNFEHLHSIGLSEYPYLIPSNGRYIRTTMNQTSVDDKMVYYGTEELPYKSYGINWSDGIFDDEMFNKIQEGLEALEDVENDLTNFVRSFLERGDIPLYENLFDGSTVEDGVLSGVTGEVGPHETFVTSDFIPVRPGEHIRVEPAAGITVVYDSEYNYIRQIGLSEYPYVIPVNGRYIRTTMNQRNVPGKYVYHGYEDMDYKPYYGGQGQASGEPLKILTIGNSYSVDTFMHLYDICWSAGINVIVGVAHESGGSLKNHMDKINNNGSIHSYYKWSPAGRYVRNANPYIDVAIKDEDWDIILFQQSSTLSMDYSTYQPHLNNLKSYVQNNVTHNNVRYGINMIWPRPISNSTIGTPEKQLEVFNDIVDANQRAAFDSDLEIYIPTGTALMNGRGNKYLKDVSNELTRDGSHLEDTVGQYLAAMTVFISLFGASPFGDVSFATDTNKYHLYLAKLAALKAVNEPFKVSDM